MNSRPNIVFIILDALRYDRCGFAGHRPGLMPNFMRLAGRSKVFHNFFSTGCPTQIAMPAVFSSTYPLDQDGYQNGIAGRRNTFTEALQHAGYRTYGIHTTSHTSSMFGYDRGFDEFIELVDLHSWFAGAFSKNLADPIKKWQAGEISDQEASAQIDTEYPNTLSGALNLIDHMDKIQGPQGFRHRRRVHGEILREQKILQADPLSIVRKISSLGRHYDLGLGHRTVSPRLQKKIERYVRLERRVNRRLTFLTRRRSAGSARAANIQAKKILARVASHPTVPTFLYVHYFDIHESRFVLPQMSFDRLKALPRDLARLASDQSPTNQAGGRLFDLGCSYVDQRLGDLLKILRNAGLDEDNTVFVLTADHGQSLGASSRGAHDPAKMFYDENLHIPLVISAPGLAASRSDQLASHLDIGPTILDLAGVSTPTEFRGQSLVARSSPPQYLLAENTGSGECNLASDPIIIAVRDNELKVTYQANRLEPIEREVFAIADDPGEISNLVKTRDHSDRRRAFTEIARKRLEEVRPQN